MGRIKKSKLSISKRNVKSVLARWNKNNNCEPEASGSRPIDDVELGVIEVMSVEVNDSEPSTSNTLQKSIFATLDHCQSTDNKPLHNRCPTGNESWCFYQRAIAKNKKPLSHAVAIKTPLRPDVISKIVPIYQRLGSDCLLSRCVEGKTQNANEALHGLLWSKCPKTVFVFKSTLTMRISEGICEYNTGYLKTIYETQQACGLIKSPGTNTIKIANRFDKIRLRIAEKKRDKKYQLFLKKKKFAVLQEEERRKEKEGTSYAPGEF